MTEPTRTAPRTLVITGGAGGVGAIVSRRLARAGHRVRVLDLPTAANRKSMSRPEPGLEAYWGDILDPDSLDRAFRDADEVFHLAGLVPPATERNPELARRVNVDGTRNVVEAARRASEAAARKVAVRFSSSVTVYGLTHDEPPPVAADHPVNPCDAYSATKVEAEEIVRLSGLPWTVYRFAAAVYLDVKLSRFAQMRIIRPENRIEFVHILDIADAFVSSIDNPESLNKTFVLGGGPRCRMLYSELIEKQFASMGMPPPNWRRFASEPFNLDWYDTSESQAVLRFQSRDFDEYLRDFKKALGLKFYLLRYLAGPLMRLLRIRL